MSCCVYIEELQPRNTTLGRGMVLLFALNVAGRLDVPRKSVACAVIVTSVLKGRRFLSMFSSLGKLMFRMASCSGVCVDDHVKVCHGRLMVVTSSTFKLEHLSTVCSVFVYACACVRACVRVCVCV
jgi:hypothetical protein